MDASEKPMKIMFIGINGAGKTTTIAKVAKLMMDGKKKVVFAAADTFRAAAIEQIEVHAGRLGVKTIKRDYGSDPTSVALRRGRLREGARDRRGAHRHRRQAGHEHQPTQRDKKDVAA